VYKALEVYLTFGVGFGFFLQHLAAGKGHVECIALLVERGAEVNAKGESELVGNYPLSVTLSAKY